MLLRVIYSRIASSRLPKGPFQLNGSGKLLQLMPFAKTVSKISGSEHTFLKLNVKYFGFHVIFNFGVKTEDE